MERSVSPLPEFSQLAKVSAFDRSAEPRALGPDPSQPGFSTLRNANPFLLGYRGEHTDNGFAESAKRVDVLLGVALELHASVGESPQVGEGLIRALAG